MPADKARAKGRQAPDWGAVAEAYANPSESMAAVARRFGISPSTLKRRAEREGWPKRVRRFSGKASAPRRRRSLATRIRELLTAQISDVEGRLSRKDFAMEPIQSERDARALSILTRTLEKLADLEAAEVTRVSDPWQDYDRERALRELEDRLAGLADAQAQARSPGEPDAD